MADIILEITQRTFQKFNIMKVKSVADKSALLLRISFSPSVLNVDDWHSSQRTLYPACLIMIVVPRRMY